MNVHSTGKASSSRRLLCKAGAEPETTPAAVATTKALTTTKAPITKPERCSKGPGPAADTCRPAGAGAQQAFCVYSNYCVCQQGYVCSDTIKEGKCTADGTACTLPPPYVYTTVGREWFECPTGTEAITNQQECTMAAKALKAQITRPSVTSSSYRMPRGCSQYVPPNSWSSKSLWFNTHARGRASKYYL